MSGACLELSIGCDVLTLELGGTVNSGVAGANVGQLVSISALSNGGVTAYPTATANAIGPGTTRVTGASADYDSIRLFGASPEIAASSGQFGSISNETDFMIDLYPLVGSYLWQDQVALAVNVPMTIGARGAVNWFVDANGRLHVRS